MATHDKARAGKVEELKKLLDDGASVDGKDKLNRSPLHMAVFAKQLEAVKLLISEGADVNSQANDAVTPLHFACQGGDVDIVNALLVAKPNVSSINSKTKMTPLHVACQKGHLEVVKLLLEKGARVDMKNQAKQKPIDIAKDEAIKTVLRDHVKSKLSNTSTPNVVETSQISFVKTASKPRPLKKRSVFEDEEAKDDKTPHESTETKPEDAPIGPAASAPEVPPPKKPKRDIKLSHLEDMEEL